MKNRYTPEGNAKDRPIYDVTSGCFVTVRPMTAGRHRPPQDSISSNIVGIFTVCIV